MAEGKIAQLADKLGEFYQWWSDDWLWRSVCLAVVGFGVMGAVHTLGVLWRMFGGCR